METETGGPAACTHTAKGEREGELKSQTRHWMCYCVFCTWFWMLRRFTRWKSQGKVDLRGAKVCKGGMPLRLGRTGSAKTSWFRMALVM